MEHITGAVPIDYDDLRGVDLDDLKGGGLVNNQDNEEDLKIAPEGSPASGAEAVLNVAKRLAAEGQQGEAERIMVIAAEKRDKGEGAKNDQGADQRKK
jgi:hypothetical protein